MNKDNKSKVFVTILLIYFSCFVFRMIEYMWLRTDRSFWGEAFVHKLIGIAILFIALRCLELKGRDIGFVRNRIAQNIGFGLLLGLSVYLAAYGTEFLIQYLSGNAPSFAMYITSYSVTGNIGNQTALLFYVICIAGNIINVVMEEGIFRGLFIKLAEKKHSFLVAAMISSVLFGLWHVMAPFRSYWDGEMSLFGMCMAMLTLAAMSALTGVKLCMLTKICGNLWLPMADHFVNNTIVNMLHVVTTSGVDELQVVRISIAQTISFFIVLFLFLKKRRANPVSGATQKTGRQKLVIGEK